MMKPVTTSAVTTGAVAAGAATTGAGSAGAIRAGIVGASVERGWARVSHVPALTALSEYEITAVSTTRRQTAEASARAIGAALAFDDHAALSRSSSVDLVVIAVNVTQHHAIAAAAIEAGKMVCCEWPLARNLAEAGDLAARAHRQGVRTLVGLQGHLAPAVRYARDLLDAGYAGRILGTTIRGAAPDDVWAGRLDPPYEFHADPANGATLQAIPAGHALHMLTHLLGDFTELDATLATRRSDVLRTRDAHSTPSAMIDQVTVQGLLTGGAVASLHYHGGPSRSVDFVWEIIGTDGTLILSAPDGYGNISELQLHGARGSDKIAALPVPNHYRLAPPDLQGPAINIASLYRQFARDLSEKTSVAPDFDAAVRHHRLIAAIEASASQRRG